MESGTVIACMGPADDESIKWVRERMRELGYTADTCRIVKTENQVMGVVN